MPAANQLEHLVDEFDFADTAGAKLDVVMHVAPVDFALDLYLELTHGAERAEIEISAKHERLEQCFQFSRRASRAAIGINTAALDPCVTFPFASLRLVIVFQSGETDDQRAGNAIGPQPHIDAEYKTTHCLFPNGANRPLAQPGEIFVVGDKFWAGGRAIFRIGKNQIDIGGYVELAPAQLAHADHDQFLRHAAFTDGIAIKLTLPTIQVFYREADRHLGQHGAGFHHFRQICQTVQVTHHHAQHDVFRS